MNKTLIIKKLKSHNYSTLQNKNYGIIFNSFQVMQLIKSQKKSFSILGNITKKVNIDMGLLSQYETMQIISNKKLITLILISDTLVLIEVKPSQYIALSLGGSK